ncbi:MAG: Lar family restriction alleviation protein [Oscillospiraceae bacterium]|nr:Lar family restriction alleviation protein [Oscillospiraceae bacterium]
MDIYKTIDLLECRRCNGVGLLEEEGGWCMYVTCIDCGCRTAEIGFNSPEEKEIAAKKAADLWNSGKTVYTGASD